MKKFIILLSLLTITIPTFAANWLQVDNRGKAFIDTTSIHKEHEYGRNVYSHWDKYLNDGSDYYKTVEQIYNKKIWYILSKTSVDCISKEFRVDYEAIYDLNKVVVQTYNMPSTWSPIPPDSFGEYIYNMICKIN